MATIENSFEIKLQGLMNWSKLHNTNFMSVHFGDQVAKCELKPDSLVIRYLEQEWDVPIYRYVWCKGRVRCLLICPRACERNCAALYLVQGKLSCRKCAGLIHASNSGHEVERLGAKRSKILDRLKTAPGQIPTRAPNKKRRVYLALIKKLAAVGL